MKNIEKLPKKFKTKLVKALRSNEYKQGRSFLYHPDNNYCCLGVAGRVAGISCDELRYNGFLDPEFVNGAEKVPPVLQHDKGIPKALAKLNDAEVPFEVIAGVIHENL